MIRTDIASLVPRVRNLTEAGQPAVVATVVSARREGLGVASRLVVLSDGQIEGSLEKGLDPLVVEAALQALHRRESGFASFALEDGRWRVARPQAGDADVFLEVLSPPPRLVIVGAGHIAVPLSQIGKIVGFSVVVLDDRAEFATSDRFPDADRLHVGPYRETLADVSLDEDSYVVLVTRGHVHDQACLELALTTRAAYIGMIGSRRRVRTVMSHLRSEGYESDRLQSVHAPVGLAIGAQTPEEIAVAIMAEIINVRRGGRAPSLALGERLRV